MSRSGRLVQLDGDANGRQRLRQSGVTWWKTSCLILLLPGLKEVKYLIVDSLFPDEQWLLFQHENTSRQLLASTDTWGAVTISSALVGCLATCWLFWAPLDWICWRKAWDAHFRMSCGSINSICWIYARLSSAGKLHHSNLLSSWAPFWGHKVSKWWSFFVVNGLCSSCLCSGCQ